MNAFVYTVFLVTAVIQNGDCFTFLNDRAGTTNVQANTSGEAMFEWNFRKDNAADNFIIKCGYIENTNIVPVIEKQGTDAPVRKTSPKLGNRIQIPNNINHATVVAFNITDVRKNDPREYKCQASVVINNRPATVNTNQIQYLQVFVRPNLNRCLIAGKRVPYVTSEKKTGTLSIECIVTGEPIPNLKCELLDIRSQRLQPMRDVGRNNITESQGKFVEVPAEASFIQCIANNEITGRDVKTEELIVEHPPFVPRNFSQVGTSNPSSIKVQWIPLNKSDRGYAPVQHYELSYYLASQGIINMTTLKLESSLTDTRFDLKNIQEINGYYTYEITNLLTNANSNIYRISLIAINRFGRIERQQSDWKEMRTGFDPDGLARVGGNNDSNLAAILGGVIGGVVLIILIVILVVWCSRRESNTGKKNYPTSYVEDAVDYPPNQGDHLYANTAKHKQKSYDDGDGYRNGGGSYPLNEPPSYGYEQSDKAYV